MLTSKKKCHCQAARLVLMSFPETLFYLYPISSSVYSTSLNPPRLPPFFLVLLPISPLPLSSPAIQIRCTDSVRMATHEILTACREFYIATFLFIFELCQRGSVYLCEFSV